MKLEDLHVGDWVRTVDGHTGTVEELVPNPGVVWVKRVHDQGVGCYGPDNLEPWQPRVGETVRHPATGVVGVVEQIYRQCALVRDGALGEWAHFDALEPATSQAEYPARELARLAEVDCASDAVQYLTYKRQAVVLGETAGPTNPTLGKTADHTNHDCRGTAAIWWGIDEQVEGGPGLAARNDLKPPGRPERWREKTTTWGPYADWDNLPDA